MSSLPAGMLQQFNIQLGHQDNASLNQIVRLATELKKLENQNSSWGGPKHVDVLPVSAVCNDVEVTRSLMFEYLFSINFAVRKVIQNRIALS